VTLASIVRAYVGVIRPHARAELGWFARQATLEAAIRNAALALNSRGKRYSHQCRLKKIALKRALSVLLEEASAMKRARDFDGLFSLIDVALQPIPGLGELYVYDTALRIGSKLNLFPEKVYLHAGTRRGARALGLNARVQVVEIKDLPSEFQVLEPHEIEDVLCIFKDKFTSSPQAILPAQAARRSWCG
jgi:hypothetical protein